MKKDLKRIVGILGCLTLVVAAAAISGVAQTVSGTLRGTVTDTNGALVPNATIVAKNTETGLSRTVVTSGDGLYNIPFLPIGMYSVEATRDDFNKVTRENVRISLNETTVLDIGLSPTVAGEVTITAEPPPINSTSQQITGTLTSEQIMDRPVANQTNFLTLAETFTGYQENPTSGQNNPTASSGSSINFNGTGSRGATFQINGVNNDDSSENQNRQGAALATIKEFQVITNSFTAEFGRGYGAVVLVQTKGGTNKVDGEAYIYHNDSALNAKSFFAHGKKAVNRRNQYGGVLGFPILKNRLFGFVSLDEVRNSGDGSIRKDVFLPAEFNESNWFNQTPANDTPANRAFIRSVLDRFGNIRPNDPTFPRVYNGAQGRNFPANDYTARMDWNVGNSDNVSARYQYSRQIFDTEDIIIGENAFQNNKQTNLGITWTHSFNSNIVGEFRYGRGFRNTLVNIAAGNDTPIIRFVTGNSVAGSIIGNTGAFPIQRYQTDNQLVYNVSWALGGNHFLKFGVDHRFQKLNDLADNFSRGFWNFGSTCNSINYGTSYNAFLNGCISTFQKGYGPFSLRNNIGESNLYAEDSWKIFPNLTFNIGMRYEYVKAPTEADNLIDYRFSDDGDNIEPRVGFAWSPEFENSVLKTIFGGPGQSSLRGGYGIYHGRLFQSIFSQNGASVRTNPPNAIFLSFTQSTNLTDPTNGFVFTPGPQTARHSETLIDPDLEMPYTQQWNLTFERTMPWSSALRVSYTGNRGIGTLKYTMDNTPLFDPSGVLVANHANNAPAVLYPAAQRGPGDPRGVDVRGMVLVPAANIACAGTGLPGVPTTTECPVAVTLNANEYSLRVPRVNERRPNGDFTTNLLISNGAWTYYHGLQLEWNKKFTQGLAFNAAYTWSKSIDTTSEATFVGTGDSNQNGNDAKALRALSRFHTPHRFTLFATYDTPLFDKDRGILGYVLGGWRISSVFKWAHGTPFSIIRSGGIDLNFDGFAEARPVILDPTILGRTIGNPETSQQDLPRSAFRDATINDFGSSIIGRNTFYTDGVKVVDLAFSKSFRMPWMENHRAHIRADLFNAFNMVQWGFPINDITNANFGRITTTGPQYAPRTIQVSFRYTF